MIVTVWPSASEPLAVTLDALTTVQLKPATFVVQVPGNASNCAGNVAAKLAVCVAPLVLPTVAVTVNGEPLRVQFKGSTSEPPTTGTLMELTLSVRA